MVTGTNTTLDIEDMAMKRLREEADRCRITISALMEAGRGRVLVEPPTVLCRVVIKAAMDCRRAEVQR